MISHFFGFILFLLKKVPWMKFLKAGGFYVLFLTIGFTIGYYYHSKSVEVEKIKVENHNLKETHQFQLQVNEQTTKLSETFRELNLNKENKENEIDKDFNSMLVKYDLDKLQFDEQDYIKPRNTRLSTSTKTVVVKLPDEWQFSGKDRRFILSEARRADKAVAELQTCKDTLNEIYSTHETYIKSIREYQKRLK